jgi:dsRNA-specific ribonuclease
VTATSELHELAVKKGVRIEFKFLEPFNFEFKHQMRMWSKDEMRGNYRVQLNVAGYEFFGQADLPQTAKHNAASQAMAVVKALPDPSGVAQVVNPPLPGAPKAEPVSVPISMDGKNVNMALNEIAMCNGCVPEWTMIGEQGPPHQKTFTWQLTLGEFSTTGTGPNKKLARNVAAEQMMAQLPEEWKSKRAKTKKSGAAGTKRPGLGSRGGPSPKKKQQSESEDGKVVITADNPVSCLYEYAKKVKIADPEFSCIAENLLETWQKANQTFKKIEYTMQLKIDGKTYLASSNQKKAAKQATAAEAWNAIRATLL